MSDEHAAMTADPRCSDAANGRPSRVDALQRLASELLGAITPAAIGDLVVTTAAGLLGADGAGVYLRTDADTLEVLHATGWPDDVLRAFRRLQLHRGRPLSDAVLDRRPVWLEDAGQWRTRYPDMASVGTAADMQASACLPLCVEDRDLGAVVFSFAAPRQFSGNATSCSPSPRCAHRASNAPACWAPSGRPRDRRTPAPTDDVPSRTTRLMEARCRSSSGCSALADLVVSEIADWSAVHLVRGTG
jgi:hypothetical protein